jgi:hypothetical protein
VVVAHWLELEVVEDWRQLFVRMVEEQDIWEEYSQHRQLLSVLEVEAAQDSPNLTRLEVE